MRALLALLLLCTSELKTVEKTARAALKAFPTERKLIFLPRRSVQNSCTNCICKPSGLSLDKFDHSSRRYRPTGVHLRRSSKVSGFKICRYKTELVPGEDACQADIHRPVRQVTSLKKRSKKPQTRVAACLVDRRAELSQACAELLANPAADFRSTDQIQERLRSRQNSRRRTKAADGVELVMRSKEASLLSRLTQLAESAAPPRGGGAVGRSARPLGFTPPSGSSGFPA